MKKKENREQLEQYDCVDLEESAKHKKSYSPLIGSFIFWFSYLEHCLNIELAENLNNRSHSIGYMVVEKLRMDEKIRLFYDIFAEAAVLMGFKKKKTELDIIRNSLSGLNTFRNQIVHANWVSINKNKEVRVKIILNKDNGYVEFKRIKITEKEISRRIEEIEKIVDKIEMFSGNFWI